MSFWGSEPHRSCLAGETSERHVVARHEIASGIADHRDAELFDERHHILAEALLVRIRMPGFIQSAVHVPPKMLDEGTEQPFIHLADPKRLVRYVRCLFQSVPLLPHE